MTTFANVLHGSTIYPDISLEWAPTSKPTDASQTYVDITSRLRDWSWQYGRNDETSEIEPGTGYVVLSNKDRALDPLFAAGAWFGNIKPRKVFRMQFKFNSVTYPGFVAYARGFPQSWPGDGKDALVKIDLIDGLAVLQGTDLYASLFTRSQEASGARVTALLNAIGIPAGFQNVDAGTLDVEPIAIAAAGTSGLDHGKLVAASEFGQLFAAKDGKITFHNKLRRFNKSSTATFTDNPASSMRYMTSFEVDFDDTYLWNYINVTSSTGQDSPGIASDSASMLDYHTLVRDFPTALAIEPTRTSLAQYQLGLYKQPVMRAPVLPIQGAVKPASVWPTLLGMEISDRITVTRFATSGAPLTFVQNVEGISHSCKPGGPWLTSIATSPADTSTYWVLEDATFGAIDGTNLLSP